MMFNCIISSLRRKVVGTLIASQSLLHNTFKHHVHTLLTKPVAGNQERLKLLAPSSALVCQVSGFKVKARLRRRCKDCYIVVRDRRTYVICPTHPRHKQMSMIKKEKFNWILTSASQSKIRPW